jgi:hypothetical protein
MTRDIGCADNRTIRQQDNKGERVGVIGEGMMDSDN